MKRRLPLVLLPVVSVLASEARADDEERRARTGVRPPSRAVDLQKHPRLPSVGDNPSTFGFLREEIKKIWAGRVLRRGVTAVHVVDAYTGEELYSVHADQKLNPASNVKLVSTAAALATLGPDWRYETRVYGAAPGQDGVSRGDVYLLGQADPTLGPERLSRMARDLAGAGVQRVDGDVVIGDHPLRDTVGVARVRLTVVGGARPGARPAVRVSPSSEFVRVENRAATRRARRDRLQVATRIETENDEPRVVVTVGGHIRPGTTRTVHRSVGRKSSFTAYTFRDAARAAGVEITGTVRIAAFEDYVAAAADNGYLPVPLVTSRSRPISHLVALINKRSLNTLADRVVMTAGAQAFGGQPSMAKGIELMHRWLEEAGIDPGALHLDTGSGLSYQTQLSARQIVRVLRVAGGFAEDQPARAHPTAYRESLAVGGKDGTLRGRLRSLRGGVVGKTGTLTGVIALAGLVTTGDDGRVLAFAIVTNGNNHRARQSVRREHDQIVGAMHGFLRTEARLAAARAGEGGATAAPDEPTGLAAVATADGDAEGETDPEADDDLTAADDEAGTAGGGPSPAHR